MKEFLLGLYIEYGDRAFPYNNPSYCDSYVNHFTRARGVEYIIYAGDDSYTTEYLPYKLTAKALEYIKS